MTTIWTAILTTSLILSSGAQPVAAHEDEGARQLVQNALQAMGGEKVLRSIETVSLKGIGHRYMLEQSERPEGPWLLDYFQISESRDFRNGRLRQVIESRGCNSTECWKSAEWSAPSTLIVEGHVAASMRAGTTTPGRASAVQSAQESLALAPERVLLLAKDAGDLQKQPDVSFHGFTHHVVSFNWEGKPVRLFLSDYTGFPSAVELTRTRPYEFFWSPWGDVTTRVTYAFWMLEPGGVHYPRAWSYESNGQPDWTFMVNELTLNPKLNAEDFAIPEKIKEAFLTRKRTIEDTPLGLNSSPAQELASGVVMVPGQWNVEEIRQSDGIVILEGPISNGYSKQVIEDAAKRFPGLPVKAVITTSDSWPHIGGLREYAARGIPVYALDLNKPILERLLSAPHHLAPDALSGSSNSPKVIYVSQRTKLGDKTNDLEIIPLRTLTGERQLVVYLPNSKILYSSDLFQRDQSGEFFLPQTLSEAADVVQREHLDVKVDIGMHLAPTAWADILQAIARTPELPTSSGATGTSPQPGKPEHGAELRRAEQLADSVINRLHTTLDFEPILNSALAPEFTEALRKGLPSNIKERDFLCAYAAELTVLYLTPLLQASLKMNGVNVERNDDLPPDVKTAIELVSGPSKTTPEQLQESIKHLHAARIAMLKHIRPDVWKSEAFTSFLKSYPDESRIGSESDSEELKSVYGAKVKGPLYIVCREGFAFTIVENAHEMKIAGVMPVWMRD